MDEWPQFRKDIPYSDISRLNTLQTCIPRPISGRNRERVWVIYIHGGAWYDPEQTASTFDKAQDMLLSTPITEHVAGYASINYRLSPPPAQSSHAPNPADPARNAKHPDHINDVLAAILHLQETYQFENRYILAGHSCGGCMALQVAMSRSWGSPGDPSTQIKYLVVPPLAILSIEGLYDLPFLVQDHASQPLYRSFVEGAFGRDEAVWRSVSPTRSDLNRSWEQGKLITIAHSRSDELVEWEQANMMARSLMMQGFDITGPRRVMLVELHGKHDQVWSEGVEVATAVAQTIEQLVRMGISIGAE